MDNFAFLLLLIHGGFYVFTGLWPLVHLRSFLAVTGPKTDLWLVRTVGALVLVVGAVLVLAAARANFSREIAMLAIGVAWALATIDVVYVHQRVIAKVYLLDALAEGALVAAWLSLLPTMW